MIDIEGRLDRVLQAATTPSRDPRFRVEILIRRERAESRRRILRACAMAFGLSIVAALGVNVFGERVGNAERLAVIAAAGAVLMAPLAGTHMLPVLRGLLGRWRPGAWLSLRFWY